MFVAKGSIAKNAIAAMYPGKVALVNTKSQSNNNSYRIWQRNAAEVLIAKFDPVSSLKPQPNTLFISLDNARHFVESNVESVWPPCRMLLSLVKTNLNKFKIVEW